MDHAQSSSSHSSNKHKYVPPHRRKQPAIETSSSSSAQSSGPELPSSHPSHPFTRHAHSRSKQRNISSQTIEATFTAGEMLEHEESTTYINEKTKVVTGKNRKVITVMNNKRNDNFDIMRFTHIKEQTLTHKAEKNNDHAMCELAELYLSDELGIKDVQKALHWLLRAANEKNSSHAMCLLAKLYESGDLGTIDEMQANEWFEKAAQRNNVYALAIIAQRLLKVYLSTKDTPETVSKKAEMQQKIMTYLNRAAKKGSTRAIWQLANIEEVGCFGEPNIPKAIAMYFKAGNLGSPSSLTSLQELVNKGALTEEQFEPVLEKASNLLARTSSELAIDIGLIQIKGLLGNNPERGFRMLESAAKKRNVQAVEALAQCYLMGEGCEANLAKAREWFKKLAQLYIDAGEKGNVVAFFELGKLWLTDKLGEINIEKAEYFLNIACQKGNPAHLFYVGKLYKEGGLGDKDPAQGNILIEQAIAIWTEQALHGDIEAAYQLIDIYLDKELGFKNYTKAIDWLNQRVQQDELDATVTLAKIYLKKKPIYRNIGQAIRLLYLATTDGTLEELTKKFEDLLKQADWSNDEKADIMATLLKLAENAEETYPYRIGRILGDVYSQGHLIEKDIHNAVAWYEKSAGFQNSRAMLSLGKMQQAGTLGEINLPKALEWYDLAAKHGNNEGMLCIISLVDSSELPGG